jgi:phosphoribosyl 1,2-cyclic phosphodiesterase
MLSLRFHGVRGSLPAPGPLTAGVGGNTSCVELRAGDTTVYLDAGTGLRGASATAPEECAIFLSHLHWDHIQGLPFFVPVYKPGSKVTVLGLGADAAMRALFRAPFHPVEFEEVRAQLRTVDLDLRTPVQFGELKFTVAKLNHPDPVLGFRVEHAGRAIVYATDTEHFACVDPSLRRLAEGADILIYDAQYLPEEYSAKVGWGHSTYEAACELARAAGVGKLVLFHHDPTRSDAAVEEIEARARRLHPDTICAREGLSLEVSEVCLRSTA